jgi:hypothetical protein
VSRSIIVVGTDFYCQGQDHLSLGYKSCCWDGFFIAEEYFENKHEFL